MDEDASALLLLLALDKQGDSLQSGMCMNWFD